MSAGDFQYTIKSGDTLSKIAQAFTIGGAAYAAGLANYNGIANPNQISAGAGLLIPQTWLKPEFQTSALVGGGGAGDSGGGGGGGGNASGTLVSAPSSVKPVTYSQNNENPLAAAIKAILAPFSAIGASGSGGSGGSGLPVSQTGQAGQAGQAAPGGMFASGKLVTYALIAGAGLILFSVLKGGGAKAKMGMRRRK
jgi:LysM repeat protein